MGGTMSCIGAPTPLPPQPTATPTTGGGPPAAPADVVGGGLTASPQLIEALSGLTAALTSLAGVLAARQGAGQVAGTNGAAGVGGAGPVTIADQTGAAGAPTAPLPDTPGVGSDARSKIVEAARAELAKGVKEDAGKDNDKGGNIKRYRSAVTGAGENPNAAEPWCADFASYVWKQAGVPFGPNGQGEDSTVAMLGWAKKENIFQARGSGEPKPGDMVLFDWNGKGSPKHVAIVEKVENGRVFTIGGNESNAIRNKDYALDDKRIIGYVPPKSA